MNIAFFELEDWERKMFQDRLGSSHTLTFFDSPLGIDLLGQINSVEILVLFVKRLKKPRITFQNLAPLIYLMRH